MGLPALCTRALRVAGAAAALFAFGAPAGAFTGADLPQPTAARQPTVALYQQGIDQPKLEQVWCRWGCGGWGWHRGWGWRGGAVVGGLAAGALVGSALAAPYYYGGGPYYG